MSDVFISYSRKDGEFVRQLHDVLHAQGIDVWIDWQNIPLSANWWGEICEGIESANTFVFIMTPDSVASPICNFEIAHAVQHNKRIVPIVRQKVDEVIAFATLLTHKLNEYAREILGSRELMSLARKCWNALARHNWLSFDNTDNFQAALNQLLVILDTDLDHIKAHTYLTVRALGWHRNERSTDYLIRGEELVSMEKWFKNSETTEPKPSELQTQFMLASIYERQREESEKVARQDRELAQVRRQQQLIQLQMDARSMLAVQFHNDYAGFMVNFILQVEIVEKLWSRNPEKALEELKTLKDKSSQVFHAVRALIWRLRPLAIEALSSSEEIERTFHNLVQTIGKYYNQSVKLHLDLTNYAQSNQFVDMVVVELIKQLFSTYFYFKTSRSIASDKEVLKHAADPETVILELQFLAGGIYLSLTSRTKPLADPKLNDILSKWLEICEGVLTSSDIQENGFQTVIKIPLGDAQPL